MKKILFTIILLLFLPIKAHAIDGEISFTWMDGNYRGYPDGGKAEYSTKIEVGHKFGWFRPYAIIETYMDDTTENYLFHPSSVDYTLGGQINYGNLFIDVSHNCWHPIDRFGLVEQGEKLTIGWRW